MEMLVPPVTHPHHSSRLSSYDKQTIRMNVNDKINCVFLTRQNVDGGGSRREKGECVSTARRQLMSV